MDEFLKAIGEALDRKGISASAASQAAVGHPAGIKNLLKRRGSDRAHPIENLIRIADTLDLELYLGPKRFPANQPDDLADDEEFVKVNRYDVKLSAGNGSSGHNEEPMAPIAFRANWMRDHGLVASSCCVVSIKGDSMEPALRDGDLVLVDQTPRPITNMGIYAFSELSGDVRVKRLEKTADHLIIKSDNPIFTTSVLPKNETDGLRIIGKVIWAGHEF